MISYFQNYDTIFSKEITQLVKYYNPLFPLINIRYIKKPVENQRVSFYKFPLRACSRSNASNNALKFPAPNDWAPCRSMIS